MHIFKKILPGAIVILPTDIPGVATGEQEIHPGLGAWETLPWAAHAVEVGSGMSLQSPDRLGYCPRWCHPWLVAELGCGPEA